MITPYYYVSAAPRHTLSNKRTDNLCTGLGDQLTYNHDALGRILTKTDQNNDTCTNNYDLAGRLTEKVYKTGGTTTESTDTFTYDAASRILTTTKGRHSVTTEHTYALDGLPLTETLIADNRTYTSSRTYDDANRPLTHTFPSGESTHWAYDARNLVNTVHYEDKIITTNTYDNGYRLKNQTFGNGLDRTINYDRKDNLRSSDILKDGTQDIDDLTMVYNYAADKQILAEQIAGDLLPSSGFTSSYDDGNRLTNWNRTSTTASTQTWNYDNAGNWNSTAKTIGNQTTTENRTHSAADQINTIAGNAATHDLKGNLTEYEIYGKEYEVTYDLDNRIISADVDGDDVEYRYDAFGRRVIRKQGSTTTSLIWWGNSECAEHKHQAGQTVIQNDIMEHPSRLNSVIARAIDGSKFDIQWYHKNYLDHVYAVSDDDGDILEHYRYTAFGEITIYDENGNLENYTQIDNHILWNTRRRDEATGYYMYKFRHYSAELGRWPSRDLIEEDGGVNLYAFVGNDGISRWDILGLQAITETGNFTTGSTTFTASKYNDFHTFIDFRRGKILYDDPKSFTNPHVNISESLSDSINQDLDDNKKVFGAAGFMVGFNVSIKADFPDKNEAEGHYWKQEIQNRTTVKNANSTIKASFKPWHLDGGSERYPNQKWVTPLQLELSDVPGQLFGAQFEISKKTNPGRLNIPYTFGQIGGAAREGIADHGKAGVVISWEFKSHLICQKEQEKILKGTWTWGMQVTFVKGKQGWSPVQKMNIKPIWKRN